MTSNSHFMHTGPFLRRNLIKGLSAHLMRSNSAASLRTAISHSHDPFIASSYYRKPGSVLCIEVFKLRHKDSEDVKLFQATAALHDMFVTKSRCKVTILDLSSPSPQVLHCQSQICDLVTLEDPIEPHRIVYVNLRQPFCVQRDSILVSTPDGGGLSLSHSYQLLIEFEAAGAAYWPPLNFQELGISTESFQSPERHWIMSTRLDNPSRQSDDRPSPSLSLGCLLDQLNYETNYVMDFDLRWEAACTILQRLADNDADIADGQMLSRHMPPDGDNQIVLSNPQLRNRFRQGLGEVHYLVPLNTALSLDRYRCISCGLCHTSIDQLQHHLKESHPTYEYILSSTAEGPLFRVSALEESTMSHQRINQIR
ncbi:hypothetical protein QQS21_002104 [Conoideocrella luteorostrata]|uniref:Uncharacterized protein n=1 Tax=Conoideocrella luteorostrata TaxID=1105319 RepID=A0AAJ0CWN6_9HYPO|nr:hypothetical protein QQS21_002104 [Conoideocrella luteorostrata]